MGYKITGEYVFNCACQLICPCAMDGPPLTKDGTCNGAGVFHIAEGNLDDKDLSGVDVGMIFTLPSNSSAGNWKIGLVIDPIVSAVEQGSLKDLCTHLASRPVILCLYGGIGEGHHVVASACDPGKKAIHLYDSNHPGTISLLTHVSGGWLHSNSGTKWRGWFMDWGHYTNGTRLPLLAFSYCRKCHGLNT